MSGGSYNYLCYKDSDNISEAREEVKQMSERLIEFGYEDVAKETQEVLSIIDSYEQKLDEKIEQLSEIWRSVEWLDSGDSGEDYIKKSVNYYRKTIK